MFKNKKPTAKNIKAYEKHVSRFKNDLFQLECTYIDDEDDLPTLLYEFKHIKPNGDFICFPTMPPLEIVDYKPGGIIPLINFISDKALQDWLERETENYQHHV